MAPPHWWLNRSPSSWGKVSKNWRGQQVERRRPVVELAGDPAAEVVDRVVAAPEDPVVAASAGSSGTGCRSRRCPAGAASRSRPAARPTAARSSARSRRPAPCASAPACTSEGNALVPRATRPARTVCPDAVRTTIPEPSLSQVRDVRVLVDPHAEALGGVGQPPGQPGRVDQGVVVARPEPGEVRRRVDLGADRLAVEVLALARLTGLLQPRHLVRLGRDRQRAGQLEVAVDAVAADRRLELGRGSAGRAARGCRSRRGTAARRCPCRGSATPSRSRRCGPDAAQPMRWASSSTTSRPGSRSLASTAVQSPEYPPPTTTRSAVVSAARAGRGAGRSGESSQAEVGAASASAGCGRVIGAHRRGSAG